MLDATIKIDVKLSDIHPVVKEQFDLTTVAGRDAIADQIEKDIEEFSRLAYLDAKPRSHLGASEIGESCERRVWFKFRWIVFEQFNGRMARLFRRGHIEEEKIIELLVGIGFNVQQVDVDGKQVRIVSSNKHFGGSSDSSATLPTRYGVQSIPLLLEFKTAKDKYFNAIGNSGVIKSKPVHWIQMCVYGYKLGLQYALYVCENKADDDLIFELLELDWELAKAQEIKAETIIKAYYPPARISNNPSFWECRFCPSLNLCHHLNIDKTKAMQPEMNCRSCRMAEPLDNGEWKCHYYQAIIPKDAIPNGCREWKVLEF
jgi:hypothetical protein